MVWVYPRHTALTHKTHVLVKHEACARCGVHTRVLTWLMPLGVCFVAACATHVLHDADDADDDANASVDDEDGRR